MKSSGRTENFANGDWLMRIRVLESGEEVDYKLTIFWTIEER